MNIISILVMKHACDCFPVLYCTMQLVVNKRLEMDLWTVFIDVEMWLLRKFDIDT